MRVMALIVSLAALSACSGGEPAGSSGEGGGGGDYKALADCSARMDAVAALYGALADASSPDKAGELRSTGELRTAAANVLKAEAVKLAGDKSAEVDSIIAATRASIDAEQAKQPFEEFGVWLGKEADRCAPMVQELVEKM